MTEKELADAKVRFRSNSYNQLESTFGKAHPLATLALFRDNPSQITIGVPPLPQRIKTLNHRALTTSEHRCIAQREGTRLCLSQLLN